VFGQYSVESVVILHSTVTKKKIFQYVPMQHSGNRKVTILTAFLYTPGYGSQ